MSKMCDLVRGVEKVHQIAKMANQIGIRNAIKLQWMERFGSHQVYSLHLPGLAIETSVRCHTTDASTLNSIFVDEQYPRFSNFCAHRIIDAGANAGYATLFYAREYPNAEIVALEPEPSNIEIVQRNCASLSNVEILPSALWFRKESLKLVDRGERKDAFHLSPLENAKGRYVGTHSILDILHQKQWTELDILKMDIEGAEKEVLENENGMWLKKVKILILEIHEDYNPGCGRAFATAVANHDFLFYRRRENYVLVRRDLNLSITP